MLSRSDCTSTRCKPWDIVDMIVDALYLVDNSWSKRSRGIEVLVKAQPLSFLCNRHVQTATAQRSGYSFSADNGGDAEERAGISVVNQRKAPYYIYLQFDST